MAQAQVWMWKKQEVFTHTEKYSSSEPLLLSITLDTDIFSVNMGASMENADSW